MNEKNFWTRVFYLMEQQGINRKTLAAKAGFDQSNIGKGMKNGNIPKADTAARIAKCLGTSVESLVFGKKAQREKPLSTKDTLLFRKYERMIQILEKMPPKARGHFEGLLEEWKAER